MTDKGITAKTAKADRSVFDHIQDLVAEEQRLYQHGNPSEADQERLLKIKVELDQYWDLLRQRRAHEEYGQDPAESRLRPARTVENYEG